MKALLNKIAKGLKSVPWYGYVSALVIFGAQYGLYRLGGCIANGISHSTGFYWIPKLAIDDHIPLVPFFILIYILSYVYWIVVPIMVSKTSKQNFINFLIYSFSALIIGFFILSFVPTYMDRNAEPMIQEALNRKGFFGWLLNLIYSNDGNNIAPCLFPSFHCLVTCFCYFGICRQKKIHIAFRITCLVLLILVVLSTVFTKQHYAIDCVAGLGIAALCFGVVKLINPGEKIIKNKTA